MRLHKEESGNYVEFSCEGRNGQDEEEQGKKPYQLVPLCSRISRCFFSGVVPQVFSTGLAKKEGEHLK